MSKTTKKQYMVFFEGVDNSGKTSIKEAFGKLCNQHHLLLDRGTISLKAYDKRYGRNIYSNELENELSDKENVIIVYCFADIEDLEYRCMKTGHEPVDYKKDISFFGWALDNSSYKKVLYLNTSLVSISDCAKTIEKYIDSLDLSRELENGGFL